MPSLQVPVEAQKNLFWNPFVVGVTADSRDEDVVLRWPPAVF